MTRIPHCHRYILNLQSRTRARENASNLAHAPNYAWTTRSLVYALLLFLLLLALLCILSSVCLSFPFLFLSSTLLSSFSLPPPLPPVRSVSLPHRPLFLSQYNDREHGVPVLQRRNIRTDTFDVFPCLGSCLLTIIFPSLVSTRV